MCDNCFRRFTSAKALIKHLQACYSDTKQFESMPEEDPILKFKNFVYRQPNILTTYADFETIQPKIKTKDQNVSHNTTNLTRHEPSGYGYIIVSPYEEFNSDVVIYRGQDAASHFINSLDVQHTQFMLKVKHVKEMSLTEQDKIIHENATHCYICTDSFSEDHKLGEKVRDHDHITGAYRGPAHNVCNLKMRKQLKMIVYMHNAKGLVIIFYYLLYYTIHYTYINRSENS